MFYLFISIYICLFKSFLFGFCVVLCLYADNFKFKVALCCILKVTYLDHECPHVLFYICDISVCLCRINRFMCVYNIFYMCYIKSGGITRGGRPAVK